jgi:hypothetical protein
LKHVGQLRNALFVPALILFPPGHNSICLNGACHKRAVGYISIAEYTYYNKTHNTAYLIDL